ncbi:hypothetical protein A1O3_03805 [Capronia epimyces CBS 606.96]|uniref:GED domain-containing protein n=1 Tax=Capronia epimyces CBS 606.96 TaxID=1182542 RepID=W9YCA3_9EURO|nr:uncharacterized protein A1O3_03805 [Capronia epimyces CBS 606.96]EXJ86851.1 hypothetical protein A1O3_03805 [Capronia epimyces CBS 606.96]
MRRGTVALKSIIDSLGIYAIEECLLKELPGLFKPETVYELNASTVTKIAGESVELLAEREDLNKKLRILQMTMTTLRRMKTFTDPGEYNL